MPYDTPYNRMIAREQNYINQKYVSHSDMTGQGTVDYRMSGAGMSGGFLGALAGPLLGAVAGPLINKIFGGGPGVAEFKSANASKKDHSESDSDCECEGESKCGGANPRTVGGAILGFQEGTILGGPKRKLKSRVMPEASFSSLGVPNRPVAEVVIGNANKVLSSGQAMAMLDRDRPLRGMGKRGRPSKKGGAGIMDRAIATADPENPPRFLIEQIMNSMSTTKDYRGEEGEKQRKAQMFELAKKMASQKIRAAQSKKEGSGIISSLGIPVVSGIAGLFGLGKEKKRGRPSKKSGGGPEMSHAKVTVKATRGKPEKVVEKSQQVGSTMSGFGKPKSKSKRAEIVKKVMKERGLSMIEASKVVKAEGLY